MEICYDERSRAMSVEGENVKRIVFNRGHYGRSRICGSPVADRVMEYERYTAGSGDILVREAWSVSMTVNDFQCYLGSAAYQT